MAGAFSAAPAASNHSTPIVLLPELKLSCRSSPEAKAVPVTCIATTAATAATHVLSRIEDPPSPPVAGVRSAQAQGPAAANLAVAGMVARSRHEGKRAQDAASVRRIGGRLRQA